MRHVNNYEDLSRRMRLGIGRSNFQEEMVGYDVIFLVEDHTFYAHRFLLASSSKPFEAMFTGQMKESREKQIRLSDLSPQVFQHILIYMYTGEIELTHPVVIPIFVAADMYAIDGLFHLAKAYLLDHASDLLQPESPQPTFQLPKHLLIEIMEDSALQIRESQLFDFVIEWGEGTRQSSNKEDRDNESLEQYLEDVMPHVRFPNMSVVELYTRVRPRTDVVSRELIEEALFFHLGWGAHPEKIERTQQRQHQANQQRKRKRVSFTQSVSFDDPARDMHISADIATLTSSSSSIAEETNEPIDHQELTIGAFDEEWQPLDDE